MTDYSELVKALRCKRDDCEGCDLAFLDNDEGWMCQYAAKDDDAAAAIEALEAEVEELKAKKMKLAENSLRFVGKVRELDKRRLEPKRGELTADEIETIRIHMNAIKERLCNQNRHKEAEEHQIIVDKLAKMEVQE